MLYVLNFIARSIDFVTEWRSSGQSRRHIRWHLRALLNSNRMEGKVEFTDQSPNVTISNGSVICCYYFFSRMGWVEGDIFLLTVITDQHRPRYILMKSAKLKTRQSPARPCVGCWECRYQELLRVSRNRMAWVSSNMEVRAGGCWCLLRGDRAQRLPRVL